MRRRQILGLLLGALALTALMSVGTAGVASAKHHKKKSKPQVTVATKTVTLTQVNEPVTVSVPCPSGTVALGGGATPNRNTDIDPSGNGVNYFPIFTASQQAGSAWATQLEMITTDPAMPRPASFTYVVQAFCRADLKGRVSAVSAVATVPPTVPPAPNTGRGSAVATCPAGTSLIGGGFNSGAIDLANQGGSVATQSEGTGNTWTASAEGLTSPTPVTSIAYCLGGKPKDRPVLTKAVGPVASGGHIFDVFTSLAACAGKSQLTGGGFNEGTGAPGSLAIFTGAGTTTAGVYSTTAVNGGGAPTSIAADAYCLSPTKVKKHKKKK